MVDETAPATTPGARQQQDDSKPRQPMYGDKRKLLDLLERVQHDARNNPARQARNRADLLNLKMCRGGEDNQWLVWDGQANTYVARPTDGEAGLPQWFFRATSNHLTTTVDGIAAILNQSQPAKDWFATKEDDASRTAAEVAEMADPVLMEEIRYPHELRPRINKLASLTSIVGLILTYDNDQKWGMDELPVLQCQGCGQYVHPMDAPNGPPASPDDPEEDVCPDCGGHLDWAADPRTNMPVTIPYPKGKIDAELLSSFELSIPKSADTAREDFVPWVAGHRRWAREDAVSRWGEKARRLLQPAASRSASSGKSDSQSYADQMRGLSSPVSAGSGNVANTIQADGPVVWRLWHDPLEDEDFYFPDGVFLTAIEGEGEDGIMESGPLPFKDDEGRPFKNVLLRQFTASPGSPWGHPPADDLVPLQKQLNLAQALAFLILMHHASPRTFIPSTVTLLDKLTGVPGKDVAYRATVPGDKPTVEPGVGFPEGLKWFLEFIIGTFEKVSKLNAVLLGQRPEGDPTLGEVEILQERGFAAFQEPLEQLVNFEKRLSLKSMWIARQSAWAPRFRRMLGDNGEWQLKQFTGTDLGGHFSVDIDLTSAWPKSPSLLNMRAAKAFELGILNPQDPEVAEEYLRLNDLQDFKPSSDMDDDQIARQLDVWKDAADPSQIQPPQPFWNLGKHLFRKAQYLKSEAFEKQAAANPMIGQAMIAHVQQLQQMQQQAAMAAAQAQAGGPPAGARNQNDGQPGAKGALEHAVRSGAMRPAGPAGSRGALDRATRSGALAPAGHAEARRRHARRQRGPSIDDLVKVGAMRPASPKAAKPAAPGTAPGVS